jgi:hypothetical protein
LYGFERITRGPKKGSYVHEKFQRDHPDLMQEIIRKKVHTPEDVDERADELLYQDMQLAPTWLPDAANVLEPTPIPDMKRMTGGKMISITPQEETTLLPGGAVTVSKTAHSSMMDAFESYFQSNVAKGASRTALLCGSSKDGVLKQPAENALQRILDQIIDPEISHGEKPNRTHHQGDDAMDSSANSSNWNVENDKQSSSPRTKQRTPRCSVFTDKLHSMLDHCDSDPELKQIISWEMQGRAFRIHSIHRLREEILLKFFKSNKFESLQRQLNIYGFTRISKGTMKGCYHHPLFVQGGRNLSKDMQRRKSDENKSATTTTTSTVSDKKGSSTKKRSRAPPLAKKSSPEKKPKVLSSSATVVPTPSPAIIDLEDFEESEDELDAMARDCIDDDAPLTTATPATMPLFLLAPPGPTTVATSVTAAASIRSTSGPVFTTPCALLDMTPTWKTTNISGLPMPSSTVPTNNFNNMMLGHPQSNPSSRDMWAFGFVPTSFH